MQRVHDFLDAGGIIPPVEIEDVDVAGAQPLERLFDRDVQRLGVVSGVGSLDLDPVVSSPGIGSILMKQGIAYQPTLM